MPAHLPDDRLTTDDVPAADASWSEVSAFGHGYHAYRVAGSLQRVAALTLEAHDRWVADGSLPDGLPRLRLALFHTVRAVHGGEPDDDTQRWARALVAEIDRLVAVRIED